MRELTPPLFQLATGLSFLIFLGAALVVRRTTVALWARLQLVGLLAVPFAFFLFSRAVAEQTLGHAGSTLVVGGAVILVGSAFAAAGLVLAARQAQ